MSLLHLFLLSATLDPFSRRVGALCVCVQRNINSRVFSLYLKFGITIKIHTYGWIFNELVKCAGKF